MKVKTQTAENKLVESFITNVFKNIAIGLIITGFVAISLATSDFVLSLNKTTYYIFLGTTILLAFIGGLTSNNREYTKYVYYAFAVMEGVVLAPIIYIFSIKTLLTAFFLTAGIFISMVYLANTGKINLKKYETYLYIGLIGTIAISFINLFILHSSMLHNIISIAIILLFMGFIIYDMQELEEIAYTTRNEYYGAMLLYIDILNIFINILSLLDEDDD